MAITRLGQRFGNLVIVGYGKELRPVVQCDCGRPPYLSYSHHLVYGDTSRCRACSGYARNTRAYIALGEMYALWSNRWKAMHNRCKNRKHPCFPSYGGRGIKVCKEWHDFANLAAFIVTLPGWDCVRELDLELDRIDNDGDYEPKNVQFITRTENRIKGGKPVLVEYSDGESEWLQIKR